MASLLMLRLPLFPFDPAVDSRRGHVHLMVIYAVVLLVQFGYAALVIYKSRALAKERVKMKLSPDPRQFM